jgi:cholest-4-en-3-one 26-monooxygenase
MTVDGDPLSIYEMRSIYSIVIGGGLESTRNAAAVGTWLFLTNPDQKQLLQRDTSLLSNAVDEIFRWTTPSRTRMRVASQDFDFHGKSIRSGDWVIASQASGNWDERVFPEPQSFDITRDTTQHLAFGEGIHKCLGRHIVKLEVATLLRKIFPAFPEMEVTGEPIWLADYSVGGFATFNATLKSEAALLT